MNQAYLNESGLFEWAYLNELGLFECIRLI